MKRVLVMCLSICLLLSCAAVPAFAASADTGAEVVTITPRANVDEFLFGENSVLDGGTTVEVTPAAGRVLNVHFYIKSGSIKVMVRQGTGSWKTCDQFGTTGHHYARLADVTNGGTYQVRLVGTACWFSGGIYSEDLQ